MQTRGKPRCGEGGEREEKKPNMSAARLRRNPLRLGYARPPKMVKGARGGHRQSRNGGRMTLPCRRRCVLRLRLHRPPWWNPLRHRLATRVEEGRLPCCSERHLYGEAGTVSERESCSIREWEVAHRDLRILRGSTRSHEARRGSRDRSKGQLQADNQKMSPSQ